MPDYSIAELTDLIGVPDRTIRFYVAQGLLLGPDRRGPGAQYPEENLYRLRLIRKLAGDNKPLAAIRDEIERLGPEGLRQQAAPRTALDYIRELRGEASSMMRRAPSISSAIESRSSVSPGTKPPVRSQWDRVHLSPDVEIHIRRPLGRDDNRRLAELMEQARRIFGEESR